MIMSRVYEHFAAAGSLHLQDRSGDHIYYEVGDSRYLRNVGNHIHYTEP
jgi:hypothetical protein